MQSEPGVVVSDRYVGDMTGVEIDFSAIQNFEFVPSEPHVYTKEEKKEILDRYANGEVDPCLCLLPSGVYFSDEVIGNPELEAEFEQAWKDEVAAQEEKKSKAK